MQARVTTDADRATITVTGELDAENCGELADVFQGVAADASVSLDLGGTSFIDSSGISALLAERERRQRHGGDLTVAACSAPVRRVLEITGLVEVFGLG